MTIRQVQLTKGDPAGLISRFVSLVINASIVGTCFLFLPTTSNGAFTRGCVIFLSPMFNSLISQSELPRSLQGRPILYKLKNYAMYRSSSFGLAQIVLDLPIIFLYNFLFSLVLYFLAGLQRTAGKFFFFVFVLSLITLCMTLFFRMCNSLAYAYKALISNEMSGLRFSCDDRFLIPYGPEYTNLNYQVCTLAGAKPGRDYIEGPDYLHSSFRYKVSEMWLNVLAIVLFWILFAALTAWAMEAKEFGKGGFSTNVFKRLKKKSRSAASGRIAPDVERGQISNVNYPSGDAHAPKDGVKAQGVGAAGAAMENLAKGSDFAWEDLDYIVP
ncbi:hypothetical protein BGX33_002829, partial [Mortierella sp. NVP41]